MNPISHAQARYLIRQSEDRRLPDQQWAALQAHLESCPDCRAYQRRIAGLQRDLRRVLRQRWSLVHDPMPDLATQVLALRAARRTRARRMVYALCGLLLFAVVIGLQWLPKITAPAPASPEPVALAASPRPTITLTPVTSFRGLVLFESSSPADPSGSRDIFLLNSAGTSAPEVSNLTDHPAQDTHPIWSPDGEWIAFLSDRTGKRELYVVTVAGTRLTQLTADPDLAWEGPLSWSADGQWIALPARRLSQDSERWGYLVPIAGGRPVSLPGTRNLSGPLKFSFTQPLLATYRQVFNIANGWSNENCTNLEFEPIASLSGFNNSPDFDWGISGNLAYTGWTKSISTNQIHLLSGFDVGNRIPDEWVYCDLIYQSPSDTPNRSVSFVPGAPYVATLQDARNNNCWTVHLVSASDSELHLVPPVEITGLCVDGLLERGSWGSSAGSSTSRWLIVTGRLQDPQTKAPTGEPGIYALRNLTGLANPQAVPVIERLANLPAHSNAVPRIRPSAASLHIQPVAASPAEEPRVQSLPPQAVIDGLIMDSRHPIHTSESAISIMRGGEVDVILVDGKANNSCPAWSPDGQEIAYRSVQPDRAYGYGIYIMNADGSSRALVNMAVEERAQDEGWSRAYGCPVWSPDGQRLAALRFRQYIEGEEAQLVIMDRESGLIAAFSLNTPSRLARPVWSSDGSILYLAETFPNLQSVSLSPVFPTTGSIPSRVLPGWDEIHAMALSPDGIQMALIAVQNASDTRPAQASLFILDMRVPGAGQRVKLPAYNPQMAKTPGRIAWLPDGRILLAQPLGLLDQYKAAILAFDPQNGEFEHIALSEDALTDWVYRDGWLIYATESGLWAQNTAAPDTLPTRLSPQIITSLDMK